MTERTWQETLEIVDAEHERFKLALGQLTLVWSDTESALRSVLRHYSGVSDEVGRALFSGTRASNSISFLKAIADNTGLESARRSDLDEVFDRIGPIATMRDWLVHNIDGSLIEFDNADPTLRAFSTERRVNRPEKAQHFKIDAKLVEDMCADLLECCWRLVAHNDVKNKPFTPGCGPTGKPKPWLYKPPQPDTSRRRNS